MKNSIVPPRMPNPMPRTKRNIIGGTLGILAGVSIFGSMLTLFFVFIPRSDADLKHGITYNWDLAYISFGFLVLGLILGRVSTALIRPTGKVTQDSDFLIR